MKRELSYREEMVQQLHIVRGEKNKTKEQTCTFKGNILWKNLFFPLLYT